MGMEARSRKETKMKEGQGAQGVMVEKGDMNEGETG